ncbi:MAG TPA: aspartate 4-decarboxylase [Streptosporangiaceae bacterium]
MNVGDIVTRARQREPSPDTMPTADRGNPNWIATEPREAFFLLGKFGLAESRLAWDEWEGVGGMPSKPHIHERYVAFLQGNPDEPGAGLLMRSLDYVTNMLGLDADAFVHELADSVIGDNYPAPERMLRCCEKIVHAYLVKEMCASKPPARPYDLFATEGGTAAMCYIFDSAMINGLLKRGDKIAIMAPLFTPYLEIPRLDRYSFAITQIQAATASQDASHTWQYDDAELAKLADPSIKALFCVNPSSPPSAMIAPASMKKLATIVKDWNPGLAIITDDVYGTFVDGFRSLMSVLPRNTIGVYSFSKYFGCTGWRLGVIAINQDNVFDEKIAALPAAQKRALQRRYSSITPEQDRLRFVDRLVADSRQVALSHTAGLSLPQQAQMALFALFALTDSGDSYKRVCQGILAARLQALTKGTLVPPPRKLRTGRHLVPPGEAVQAYSLRVRLYEKPRPRDHPRLLSGRPPRRAATRLYRRRSRGRRRRPVLPGCRLLASPVLLGCLSGKPGEGVAGARRGGDRPVDDADHGQGPDPGVHRQPAPGQHLACGRGDLADGHPDGELLFGIAGGGLGRLGCRPRRFGGLLGVVSGRCSRLLGGSLGPVGYVLCVLGALVTHGLRCLPSLRRDSPAQNVPF